MRLRQQYFQSSVWFQHAAKFESHCSKTKPYCSVWSLWQPHKYLWYFLLISCQLRGILLCIRFRVDQCFVYLFVESLLCAWYDNIYHIRPLFHCFVIFSYLIFKCIDYVNFRYSKRWLVHTMIAPLTYIPPKLDFLCFSYNVLCWANCWF